MSIVKILLFIIIILLLINNSTCEGMAPCVYKYRYPYIFKGLPN